MTTVPEQRAGVGPIDSIEWSRRRWQDEGQPDPDHFAAVAAVLRLHQIVSAALDRLLREHGLNRTGYLVLATLYLARDRTLPMGQLGRRLLLHPTTISLTVDALERRGVVERVPHATDRRTTLATLTAAGTAELTRLNEGLGAAGYGLGGVDDRLAITLTEVIRQVRHGTGDT